MTANPTRALRLLADAPRRRTPKQHIRNAIQSLILADERAAQLLVGGDPLLTDLLRNAEARCFRALFQLGMEAL
jgi:hypothetical protein